MPKWLPIILSLVSLTVSLEGQSPHGADFKMDCAACHTAAGWEISADSWEFSDPGKPRKSRVTGMIIPEDTTKFNHFRTEFPLTGQHVAVDCRSCHSTLVFSEASTDCISCHTDMHRTTVGSDCARCHTTDNWLVDNVTEIHQDNGFPLTGPHAAATCTDCHTSETGLEFPRIGNDCVNCHLSDFNTTTNPNHQDAGFPTDCLQCHRAEGLDWETDELDHSFFPLTNGHNITNCAECHTGGDFADTPTDCFACHQTDFENTSNPNHQTVGFSNTCTECHTTDPGWMPAEFSEHDALFPIYSGAHDGTWMQCIDCHSDPSNYSEFQCINCHTNPETDESHDGVDGYVYENTACLACHPTGGVDNIFDHNSTNFPLTGAHIDVECTLCHTNGYEGTPTTCESCHTEDFNNTTNPNHQNLGLSTDCASCHTTDPGWMPASFDIHDEFYPLNGAHTVISNECATCHNGDYNNTPNTCAGCHTEDFNQTTDPNHQMAQFPTDCASCHSEDAWIPSSFNHDEFYPLSGGHMVIADDCVACHNGDYENTPNTCAGCHTEDYTSTVNPDHQALGLPTDCESCHTTEPNWMPASFDIHDEFYPLNGAHAAIANDCTACHNGDYNSTPNTCFGCHSEDYNNTSDPNHVTAQFSTDCTTCHTEGEWIPSTFDHDGQYFPIYTGSHQGEWSDCTDCHTNLSNYAEVSCVACHINPETDDAHAGVGGYVYENTACLACHPTGDVDNIFDHNMTGFPLTGAHLTVNCLECHSSGYEGTPTDCASCHTGDFNNTENPNHNSLGLSMDCATCHTTDPGWSPASFNVHDEYYPLNGAHAVIADDCASCHNGDYNNTPNTCAGCHTTDFNETTDPDHEMAQFPTDCASCHSESAWIPSSFNHDEFFPLTGGHQLIADDCVACHNGDYQNTPNTCAGCHTQDFTATVNPDHEALGLPTDCESCHTTEPDWMPATFDIHNDFYALNGAHAAIANDCAACHNGDYNSTPNTCFGCHSEDYSNTINPNHVSAQFSTTCTECHTESEWIPSTFDHDGQHFPIYSGAHNGEWMECTDCHSNLSNYSEVTCTNCHMNPETNDEHEGVVGYVFESSACLACHPTGDADNVFDHNMTAFPLTGAHLMVDCQQCHANAYEGTPTACSACHAMDFNNTTNPDHNALGFPDDCTSCHTTDPGWSPATFDIHNDYYALNGAHTAIANDCATCHNGDYNNTPNTCAGCHTDDYNQTTDPDHQAAQFPTDCASCHSEDAWIPSSFDHDQFYPLTGHHATIADDCAACHNGDYENTPNTCAGCHTNDYNQSTNPDHQALGLPDDCESCHTTDPGWSPATFDIHNDYYALNGAHAAIANECATCHNGDYNNTPNTCAGCHTDDYNQTTNPDHQAAQFPTDCASCHSEDAWIPSSFDHDQFYPIEGAHVAIENDCNACHNGDYTNTPNTCAGCHTNDYNQSTNPDHQALGLPDDCESCHTTDPGWSPATFDIHNDYYALNGAHAAIANDCATCHNGDYNNTPNTCAGCHTDDYNQTTNPDHQAAQFPTDCASCHSEDAWIPSSFDHDQFYPIEGAHVAIENDCNTCHNGDYTNTPNTCAGCHTVDFNQTTNPNHQDAQFSMDCTLCHSQNAWVPSTFDHDQHYPLTGAHAAIANDCEICHNGDYDNTPNTCAGCHTDDFNQTVNPNHTALGIPNDCESCHTTDPGWSPATFAIHNDYYALNGAHAAIANDCAICHNGDYNNTPNTCAGCHTDDYNQTTNPDHQAAQFPMDCATCHSENAWIPSSFDHDQFYPIEGAHVAIENDCNACHNGDYTNTPNTCAGCHTVDFNQTTNPDHQAAQFSTDCTTCHTQDAWSPANFDHDPYYLIIGAHLAVENDCNACHSGGYTNTPNTCAGCHTDDYNQTTNPDHQAAQFPTDCASCHTQNAWSPANFDHDQFYPIVGAHVAIENDCNACHNGDYNNTPNTCDGCHLADYNQTTNPDHQAAQFPLDCESCHTQNAWLPSTFDHSVFYPFTGAHIPIANDCVACHNGDYDNTPNTCAGCHTDDYNASVNPNHQSLGIPTDCDMCHTTDPDWMPATFPIHDNYYQLNGAHAIIANDCVECHNGDYNNTPNTCFGCHATAYNQTTNPDHQDAGFPTDCQNCHSEDAWIPANFDHDQFYPLTGAHAAIADNCAICHNGDYNNTPNTCFGCHSDDYNQTVNPNHSGAGFPTDCEACHTTIAWQPATFDHDGMYFPIYSGKHDGEWNDCSDCHFDPNNYSLFNCLNCHFHDDPVQTAGLHENVGGYQYESNACYACHPDGTD